LWSRRGSSTTPRSHRLSPRVWQTVAATSSATCSRTTRGVCRSSPSPSPTLRRLPR